MSARPPSSPPKAPLTEFLRGRDLWHQIHSRLGETSGRVAAIAYLGADAPVLLHGWGKGDFIVCDASEKALRSGSTSPDALMQFVLSGVEVRSLGVLHAKVIANHEIAIVGSMNASQTSTRTLIETAVASRDKATVRSVNEFVRSLRQSSLLVDKRFVAQARRSYRPSRRGGVNATNEASAAPRVQYTEFSNGQPPRAVAAVIAKQAHLIEEDNSLKLDWSWMPNREYRRGDWVVAISRHRVIPPALCIAVDQAPGSNQIVFTFVERYDAAPIPRTQFETDLLRRGFRLREDGFVRSEGLVEAIHGCFCITPQLTYDAVGGQ